MSSDVVRAVGGPNEVDVSRRCPGGKLAHRYAVLCLGRNALVPRKHSGIDHSPCEEAKTGQLVLRLQCSELFGQLSELGKTPYIVVSPPLCSRSSLVEEGAFFEAIAARAMDGARRGEREQECEGRWPEMNYAALLFLEGDRLSKAVSTVGSQTLLAQGVVGALRESSGRTGTGGFHTTPSPLSRINIGNFRRLLGLNDLTLGAAPSNHGFLNNSGIPEFIRDRIKRIITERHRWRHTFRMKPLVAVENQFFIDRIWGRLRITVSNPSMAKEQWDLRWTAPAHEAHVNVVKASEEVHSLQTSTQSGTDKSCGRPEGGWQLEN
ncbi:hypothetical protein DFH09DRAFT_1079297 [Mycena vulgaris]|nr:hypothetical protein DFH09DRAFT_1079297 [Mycena vulgaris]